MGEFIYAGRPWPAHFGFPAMLNRAGGIGKPFTAGRASHSKTNAPLLKIFVGGAPRGE